MRAGVRLLSETPGTGELVERHAKYSLKLRLWLHRGEPVVWDGETTLTVNLRVDRASMFAGLFHGVQGMRIGGTRTLEVAPHLGYGEAGIPGKIPANALLVVEVHVVGKVTP